jgi:hypothetical protein
VPTKDQGTKRERDGPMKLSESDIAPHQTLGPTGKRFSLSYSLWLSGQANDDAVRYEFEQADSE